MQGLLLLLAFVALLNLFFSPDYLLAEEYESSVSSSQKPQEEEQSPIELKYTIRKVIDIDYKQPQRRISTRNCRLRQRER